MREKHKRAGAKIASLVSIVSLREILGTRLTERPAG